MSEAIAGRCAELGIVSVQVTLNGPDAELHEAHANTKCFGSVLAGVSGLGRVGVPVVGCIVVTRRNAAEIGRILELWRTLGVETVALSRFSPVGFAVARGRRWLPQRDDLRRAFASAAKVAREGWPHTPCRTS